MPSLSSSRFVAAAGFGEVSSLLMVPDNAVAMLVLAHGAGAGIKHAFMEKVAAFLAEEGIATFRFNFPYIEKRKRVPDVAAIAMKTIQSAVETAAKYCDGMPVFAGGKSFGGRMTSQSAAAGMLAAIKGIVFFGFPLHAPGKPGNERAAHLYDVKIPMLFLQGTRDTLADILLMRALCAHLGRKATLHEVEGGDHSFHVSKQKDEAVLRQACTVAAGWMNRHI